MPNWSRFYIAKKTPNSRNTAIPSGIVRGSQWGNYKLKTNLEGNQASQPLVGKKPLFFGPSVIPCEKDSAVGLSKKVDDVKRGGAKAVLQPR